MGVLLGVALFAMLSIQSELIIVNGMELQTEKDQEISRYNITEMASLKINLYSNKISISIEDQTKFKELCKKQLIAYAMLLYGGSQFIAPVETVQELYSAAISFASKLYYLVDQTPTTYR